MNDPAIIFNRLLSEEEISLAMGYEFSFDEGQLHGEDAIETALRAQDARSYPLGEEAGIAKGRAEVVAFIDKEYSWIIPRDQLKAWGRG